jgi:alkyl sulfatase BDS1-like metallo-beta-lactamase superfamily hydrolase
LPCVGAILLTALALASPAFAQSRDAEPATRAANGAFVKSLPFSGRADFDDAKRGSVAMLPDGVDRRSRRQAGVLGRSFR